MERSELPLPASLPYSYCHTGLVNLLCLLGSGSISGRETEIHRKKRQSSVSKLGSGNLVQFREVKSRPAEPFASWNGYLSWPSDLLPIHYTLYDHLVRGFLGCRFRKLLQSIISLEFSRKIRIHPSSYVGRASSNLACIPFRLCRLSPMLLVGQQPTTI
ncbi:hypothetical protein VNO77_46340 [Canavalia gladiata]|uniref:Uncharacterized protein n=1 Tax=Canavalia gladiata TaxID=3824 RepID=A0AAN9PER4_CANGL